MEDLTAERRHLSVRLLESPNGSYGVLVGGLELSVNLRLTLQVHLTEHVQGRFLASTASSLAILIFEGSSQLPATFVAAEAEWLTVLCGVSKKNIWEMRRGLNLRDRRQ